MLFQRWQMKFSSHKQLLITGCAWLLLFGFTWLKFLPELYFGLHIYDEGIAAVGADFVLQGAVPYRDFWTLYGPANYWWHAGLFAVFGKQLLVIRYWSLFATWLLAVAVYQWQPATVGMGPRLAAGILFLFYYRPVFGYPLPAALLCTLLALWTLLLNQKYWMLTTGLLVGMAGLFRQDLGFYNTVIFSAILLLTHDYRSISWRQLWSQQLLPFWFGIVLIVGPMLVYFAWHQTLWEFVRQTALFPTQVYPQVRALPYPNPIEYWQEYQNGILSWRGLVRKFLEYHLFWMVPGILLLELFKLLWSAGKSYWYARANTNDKIETRQTVLLAWLLPLIGLCCWNIASVRSDIFHLAGGLLFAVILGWRRLAAWRQYRWGQWLLRLLTAVIFAHSLYLGVTWSQMYWQRQQLDTVPLPSDRAIGVTISPSDIDYLHALLWVQQYTKANDLIFVGNRQHRQVEIGDMIFYFLVDRPTATRYVELHPGLQDQLPIQKAMLVEFQTHPPQWILLRLEGKADVPFAEPAATPLDQYIREHYEPIFQNSAYLILAQRSK